MYDRVYLVVQHLGTAHLREKMGLKISRNPYRMKSDATLPKQRAVLWTVITSVDCGDRFEKTKKSLSFR